MSPFKGFACPRQVACVDLGGAQQVQIAHVLGLLFGQVVGQGNGFGKLSGALVVGYQGQGSRGLGRVFFKGQFQLLDGAGGIAPAHQA